MHRLSKAGQTVVPDNRTQANKGHNLIRLDIRREET